MKHLIIGNSGFGKNLENIYQKKYKKMFLVLLQNF